MQIAEVAAGSFFVLRFVLSFLQGLAQCANLRTQVCLDGYKTRPMIRKGAARNAEGFPLHEIGFDGAGDSHAVTLPSKPVQVWTGTRRAYEIGYLAKRRLSIGPL